LRLRVLQLITKSDWAGAQRIVYEICKGIKETADTGIDVEVAMNGEGPLVKKIEDLGVKVHIIRNFVREINPIKDLAAYIEIKELLKKNKYDVVHCHSSKAGILGRIAAKKTKIKKVIYTIHGWWGITQYKGFRRKVALSIEKHMSKMTHKLVFVCNKDKDFAMKYKIGRSTQHMVISNKITVPRYQTGKLRSILGVPETTKIVGNVARLSPPKNPIRFVEVSKRIVDTLKEVMFVWIGDGELKQKAEELSESLGINERTRFIGFHENGAELMADFDCLLMTSDDEGLPITVLEAVAQGIPVVSTDVGGVKEILSDRDLVMPIGETIISDLSKAVVRALNSESKEVPLYSLSSKDMIDAYVKIYKE